MFGLPRKPPEAPDVLGPRRQGKDADAFGAYRRADRMTTAKERDAHNEEHDGPEH